MNLLVTGAWKQAAHYLPLFEENGYYTVFMQNESDALPCDPSAIDAVICNGLFVSHPIEQFSSLRLIQLTSAGTDRVPLDIIKQRQIILKNARGVYSVPMAEHALLSALHFFRKSRFFFVNQMHGEWKKDRKLRELSGSSVCIIGCGSVGTECARRFSALGCSVTGVDLLCQSRPFFDKCYPISCVADAAAAADILVLSLPLTEETSEMVDEAFLGSLKQDCVIINISRGKIICTDALVKALRQDKLFAALDVFEEEPLDKNSPLWRSERVIITPHNSFVSDKTDDRLSALILQNFQISSGVRLNENSNHIPKE